MNKELEKLLFNPVRLKILSFLFSVENASFKKLIEVSDATKGNISVQIKKLEDAGLIKVRKKFEGNYPLTLCKITSKGKTSFCTVSFLQQFCSEKFSLLGLIVISDSQQLSTFSVETSCSSCSVARRSPMVKK